ncbi:hypothetical protein PV08_04431 [Exophiala spinifera]|uniref:Pyridoxamine 5'-phosphate oxidase putative domain-containing protein n=1 Tax=Exophiala spinifera TaxID=91928 RepID=A0A0D2BF35_9EURO|nr:uncharacterized protein PV08_04431 [Exophiala spinifera]KIW17240.1 hypothetical protein PV08_04431 [Exophiala spinifera]
MGAFYETLPPSLITWLLQQKVFCIGSAPLSGAGHINVSPKGVTDRGGAGPFFGVIKESKSVPGKVYPPSTSTSTSTAGGGDDHDETDADNNNKDIVVRKFWYVDLTGSGIETTSHLHEPGNGRITVMFMAFDGPPRILRLYGKGRVLEYGTPAFDEIVASQGVKLIPGTRSIIVVDIDQVGTSCGFSVPKYDFVEYRPTLHEFFEKRVANEKAGKREDGIERYWAFKNAWSMDGLPGMQRGLHTAVTDNVKPIKKMVGPHAPRVNGQYKPQRVFVLRHLILAAVLSAVSTVVMMFFLLRLVGVDIDIKEILKR